MALGFNPDFPRPYPSFNEQVTPPDVDPDAGTQVALCLAEEWVPVVLGALDQLILPYTWEGDADTVALAIERATLLKALIGTPGNACPNDLAPYWDSDTGDDLMGDSEEGEGFPWYGSITIDAGGYPVYVGDYELSDWLIGAFIAIVAGDKKAVRFLTASQQFTLAFRGGDWGAAIQIFIDGILFTLIDTFRTQPEIVKLDVTVPSGGGMGSMLTQHELIIAIDSSATNPGVVGTPQMQLIRKELVLDDMPFLLRQNTDNSCLLEQSIDGGTTWTTAFDYSLCIPPAQQTILQTVLNNNSYTNPWNSTENYTSSPGDTDARKEERYQALCYACTTIVSGMASECYSTAQGLVTAETLLSVALGVVGAFAAVISAGALAPFFIAAASAAAAAAAAIGSLDSNVWLNSDNLSSLSCLMFQNLQNLPVSLASFQTAFNGADCLTADQQSMASVFSSMLSDEATAENLYTSFNNCLGDAVSASVAGVLGASCVCDDTTWCFEITPDSLIQWGWWDHGYFPCSTLYTGQPNGDVETVSGVHVWHMATASFVGITFKFYLPSGSTITEALGYYDPGTYPNDNNGKRLEVNTTTFCATNFASNPIGSTSMSITGGQTVTVNFSMLNNSGGANKTGFLSKVRLGGTGVSPFGACSPC